MKNHVVNKVSIRLPASDYENARNLQKNAQNWSSHYLPGILEKVFDEYSKNNEYYFIDKVEIELTKFPWQLTEQEWKQKLAETLLGKSMPKLPVEVVFKHWVFYLANGVFERNAVIKKLMEIEKFFFEHKLKFSSAELFLLNRVFSSETSIKRLFFSHSEAFVCQVITHFFKFDKIKSEQIYKEIKSRMLQQPSTMLEFIKKLNYVALQKRSDLKEKMLERILQNPDKPIIDESVTREPEDKKVSEKEEDMMDSGVYLYCANAGFVILLPFIKRFLEHIGLVENDSFIEESAKLKACNVLHFLATGKAAEEEQHLLLPKILCGIEISEYVELTDIFTENIQSEAEDLLVSVIQHWEILKNTSVESLRESFLERDGQLRFDSAFILQVSTSGLDVLLDSIPWGFRNFKLPWMQQSLITEWH
ncbi:hypothetical protein MASR2M47_21430 [Draconibacterium sp.]